MRGLRNFLTRSTILALSFVLVTASGALLGSAPAFAQDSWNCNDFPRPATTPHATPSAHALTEEIIPFPGSSGQVTIFAASSLTEAFTEIERDLESDNPGLDLVFSYAGSQTLVTQLSEGAPADVLATANVSQMQNAIDAGVIAGEASIFTHNRLAIVVPADNPAGIASIADLDNEAVQLVLAAADVPVGQYARTALCAADATGDNGEGFAEAVAANVVSNESNVRNVLTKVVLGEADAGIVYETDITNDVAADVIKIEIPAKLNVVASYPIAAVDGGNTAAAAAFISYILSQEGQARLAEFGFS